MNRLLYGNPHPQDYDEPVDDYWEDDWDSDRYYTRKYGED
jgi:hypothetical protein